MNGFTKKYYNSHKLNLNFGIHRIVWFTNFFCLIFCFIHTKWEGEKGQDKRKYLLTDYYVPDTFTNISL